MGLLEQVREAIDRHQLLMSVETVVVGVSGGPDSLCLLHVLSCLADDYGLGIRAAHLDHGIRGEAAAADARFVEAFCAERGIPCVVEEADVPALVAERGLSVEEAARQARYAFLGRIARLSAASCVAVAHHADDQVETVLMHFLRGAGLVGLRGMQASSLLDEPGAEDGAGQGSPLTEGRLRLIRPLLQVSRAAVESYCEEHELKPRLDRSNLDNTYFRNRLRHELIPYLEGYNPNLREIVRRTADVIAEEYKVLRQLVDERWRSVVISESDEAIVYDRGLRDLPIALQRSLIREGVHRLRCSLRDLSWVHVDDALRVLRAGKVGTMATLPGGLRLTLCYDVAVLAIEGYVSSLKDRPRVRRVVPLSTPGRVSLPDSEWCMVTQVISRDELPQDWDSSYHPDVAYLDAKRLHQELALRPRQEGDWFVPLGFNHRQKVAQCMINAKVPQRDREAMPLLVCGRAVLWIVGLRLDGRYAVRSETEKVLVVRVVREEA